ncbi:MAG TPA: glucose-1-phosphate cytidylyltransferase [Ruminococcaceae bacterium]|nr:glucose-1-phosphate cytidylyltransferase [Oscillospiraceae bacterium]
MEVVILAGGLPSSISEQPDGIPKPMAEIGGRPLLWHIMKSFSQYGLTDFIICAGYRSYVIKQYFLNYYVYKSDITVDLAKNKVTVHNKVTEPWAVTILDTGVNSSTAERVKQAAPYLEGDDFIVCYGDCLSDININSLIDSHSKDGHIMTAAVAKPTGRNTIMNIVQPGDIKGSCIPSSDIHNAWVNACTMVVNKRIFAQLEDMRGTFETDVLNRLAQIHEVSAFYHDGFWCPVETVRDRNHMQQLWESGHAPWKIWND